MSMGCSSSAHLANTNNTENDMNIENLEGKVVVKTSGDSDGKRFENTVSIEEVVLKRVRAHKFVYTRGWDPAGKSEGEAAVSTHLQKKHPKTECEAALINKALEGCYLFSDSAQEIRTELLDVMRRVHVEHGAAVLKQGDCGDEAYIAQAGTFDVIVNGVTVNTIGKGALFGEAALMFDEPRNASVLCATPDGMGGELWAIDRVTFRHLVAKSYCATAEEYRAAAKSVPLLADHLTAEQLDRCIEVVKLVTFSEGERIVAKGEVGEVCYFIKEGSVLCSNIGQSLGELMLEKGAYFGELALLKNEPRAADVTALEKTQCLAFDRTAFTDFLGDLRSVMDENMQQRVIDSVSFLQELEPETKAEIVSQMTIETFGEGATIIAQGSHDADRMFIVRSGEVLVQRRSDRTRTLDIGNREMPVLQTLATLREGTWFGEMAMINEEPRGATCSALCEVECFVLSSGAFKLIRERSRTLRETALKRQALNAEAEESATISKYEGLQLSHLEQVEVLGKGTFGTVLLVKSQTDAPIEGRWALKVLSKQYLHDMSQVRNVNNEKDIMNMSNHPFVLKLHRTYQDEMRVYMLLEFIQGGELFSLLQERDTLSREYCAFYVACILLGFEYLHTSNILYRDLKPENILIDYSGYIKIADFGFAKALRSERKTFTLCGTPEYLAPEVVLGKGHDKGADYWALGVLMFEMLAGVSPFADIENDDQLAICNNIVQTEPDYATLAKTVMRTELEEKHDNARERSNSFTRNDQSRSFASFGGLKKKGAMSMSSSKKTIGLLKHLLEKLPTQRFGSRARGVADIKDHPFFAKHGIDSFDDLKEGRISAPFVPTISDPLDTSNFDEYEPMEPPHAYNGPPNAFISF